MFVINVFTFSYLLCVYHCLHTLQFASSLDPTFTMTLYNSRLRINDKPSQDDILPQPNIKMQNKGKNKLRVFLTMSMCLSFLSLGLANSLLGPTLLHLTHLFNTDVKTLSIALTLGNIAYMLGSLVCGILYDFLNPELQFMLTTFLTGVFSSLIPFAPSVYIYYLLFSLQHLCMGYVDAGGQAYIIALWNGNTYKEPILQSSHSAWSLGATLCPFVLSAFLSDLPTESNSTTLESSVLFETNVTPITPTTMVQGLMTDSLDMQVQIDFSGMRNCYMVIGLIIIALSGFFGAAFVKHPSIRRSTEIKNVVELSNEETSYIKDKLMYIFRMTLLFFFYFAYIWYEAIPGYFLAAFATEYLGWTSQQGALVTSVFWGAHGVGRLLAIPVSICLRPGVMLVWNLALTATAFIAMLFIPIGGDVILWCAVPLAGFAMSSIFASMILWALEWVNVSGRVGALLLIGTSLGGSTGAVLAGWLLTQHGYMWMVYISLAACVADCVIYVMLRLAVRTKAPLKRAIIIEVEEADNLAESKALCEDQGST